MTDYDLEAAIEAMEAGSIYWFDCVGTLAWEMPDLDPDDWIVAGERFERDRNQLELPFYL